MSSHYSGSRNQQDSHHTNPSSYSGKRSHAWLDNDSDDDVDMMETETHSHSSPKRSCTRSPERRTSSSSNNSAWSTTPHPVAGVNIPPRGNTRRTPDMPQHLHPQPHQRHQQYTYQSPQPTWPRNSSAAIAGADIALPMYITPGPSIPAFRNAGLQPAQFSPSPSASPYRPSLSGSPYRPSTSPSPGPSAASSSPPSSRRRW